MEFDKSIFMNNIPFLLKRRNMKIGDLESKIGVSKGYISRINKKNHGVAAGVDIVYKIAQALEVSVDVLISVDLQMVNDNEIYLLNLLKSFERKTESREIFWDKTDIKAIHDMLDGKIGSSYPMLETHPDVCSERYDDYEYISKKIYVSHFLGTGFSTGDKNHSIGPWFRLKLDDLNTVCLTDVIYCSYGEEPSEVLEIYVETEEYYENYDEEGCGSSGYLKKTTPLCCSKKMGNNIEEAMKSLYRTIMKHQNDIRIPVTLKGILDDFMKREK